MATPWYLRLTQCFALVQGDIIFKKQLAEFQAQGKVLKDSHPDYKFVHNIAERVIAAVEKGKGGMST